VAPNRPKTMPETPMPKAIERAVALAEVEADVEWIKQALVRIEAKPPMCVQDAKIAAMDARHRVVTGVLAAVALAVLGAFGTILATCQSTSHAAGVNETRIESHSQRILAVERSIAEMNKAREADTVRILEAIRGRGE
jgi:hypothetical protein